MPKDPTKKRVSLRIFGQAVAAVKTVLSSSVDRHWRLNLRLALKIIRPWRSQCETRTDFPASTNFGPTATAVNRK